MGRYTRGRPKTTPVHHSARQCGGVTACGTGAAGGDADDWASRCDNGSRIRGAPRVVPLRRNHHGGNWGRPDANFLKFLELRQAPRVCLAVRLKNAKTRTSLGVILGTPG